MIVRKEGIAKQRGKDKIEYIFKTERGSVRILPLFMRASDPPLLLPPQPPRPPSEPHPNPSRSEFTDVGRERQRTPRTL